MCHLALDRVACRAALPVFWLVVCRRFVSLERRISSFKQRLLCVILEGVTERVFGRTYALASQWRYLQWQKASRDLWQPVFCPPQLPVPPVAPVRLRRNSV